MKPIHVEREHMCRPGRRADYKGQRGVIPVDVNEPSLTVQAEQDGCDIDKIMERYQRTGLLPHVNSRQPQYGDFTGVVDYREALDVITRAQEGFMSLPAKVRARFDNDPSKLIEFIQDSRNEDEAEKLGLLSEEAMTRRAKAKGDTPQPAALSGASKAPEGAAATPPGGGVPIPPLS